MCIKEKVVGMKKLGGCNSAMIEIRREMHFDEIKQNKKSGALW